MGPPTPEGCMGQVWEGTSPRWAGAPPPPTGPKAQGSGGRGQTLGQMGPKAHPRCASPLPPSGRHQMASGGCRHPWGGNPRGGAAPSPPPINSGGFGAARDARTSPSWRSPTSLTPPLPRCLVKPRRIAMLLHHHHAVVLLLDGASSTSPSLLAGSRHGRRHRALRVLNAEVPSVRH